MHYLDSSWYRYIGKGPRSCRSGEIGMVWFNSERSEVSTGGPFERIWLRLFSKRSLSSAELALPFYLAPHTSS